MAEGTLVDSNVLLDILTEDATWREWSRAAIETAGDTGPLIINPVIYSEVSVRFSRIEELDAALSPQYFERVALPWDAAFLAGKAFVEYRRRGGPRTSTLPDFFIGAHAAVDRLAILTRDARRYQSYFPTVQLVTPLV